MSRTTFIYDPDLDCVRQKYGDNYFEEPKEGPSVITDDLKGGVNGLRNHADGRMYDGKRAFEAATRRAGAVTVGNEEVKGRPPELIGKREIGETIKRSIEELSSGNREALHRAQEMQERMAGRR